MDRAAAEKLQLLALPTMARLSESLEFVEDNGTPEEAARHRRAVATLLGAFCSEVLLPIHAEHPDLLPEGLRGPYKIDPAAYGPPFYTRPDKRSGGAG